MKDKIFIYAKEKYNTEPEYLWKSSPDSAVLRHRRNRKWYGLVMLVPKEKLGLKGSGDVWVLNVKATGDTIEQIPDSSGFFLGYHMNKKHWMSILLDGTVPSKVLYKYLDISYKLTK